MTHPDDAHFMQLALAEARTAARNGDVPVGAVIVDANLSVLACASNRREQDNDPTAHAELLALRDAAQTKNSWRLDGCTMYVTLEPCVMCAGALVLARLDTVVFAADDPKAGACGALYDIVRDPALNHQLTVRRGVCANEANALLVAFFAKRR
ncbi:MAG: tRNA adenosine(34) deaminase TadA [Nitriliruptoraceae bacterium]